MNCKETAEKLNHHLATGNTIVVSTYTKAWQYGPRNTGAFEATDKDLFVKRGRGRVCIGTAGAGMLVGVRFYKGA